jgi:hypothetical protein
VRGYDPRQDQNTEKCRQNSLHGWLEITRPRMAAPRPDFGG